MNIDEIIERGLPDNLELLSDDHPILKKKMPLFEFEKIPSELPEQISRTLALVMLANGGIGLAANQVGLEIRAFCIILGGKPQTLFNPTILELTESTHKMKEGCLTFPELFLDISRPEGCRVNYEDLNGNRKSIVLRDIEARCAMHEIDHLNGVLFTSKISKMQLKMRLKKIQKSRG